MGLWVSLKQEVTSGEPRPVCEKTGGGDLIIISGRKNICCLSRGSLSGLFLDALCEKLR